MDEMKVLKSEFRLCHDCMEEHEVKTVLVDEVTLYKDKELHFECCYYFCDKTDDYYMDEEQMTENDIHLKDAIRKFEGLLSSSQIRAIRDKYSISQSDLSNVLGWGGKTITRYESHQVQDRAHDAILRRISEDPEWFHEQLIRAKEKLSPRSFEKCEKAVMECLKGDIEEKKREKQFLDEIKKSPFTYEEVLNLLKQNAANLSIVSEPKK